MVEQSLPGRDRDDRNGGRFDIAEQAWFLRKHPGRRHPVLGISVNELRVGHAEDLVCDRQLRDLRTHSGDFAGQVRAQCERERLRQCTLARPDPSVPGAKPAACTLTRTSPQGSGRGTVSRIVAPGGPNACTRQAFIEEGSGSVPRCRLLYLSSWPPHVPSSISFSYIARIQLRHPSWQQRMNHQLHYAMTVPQSGRSPRGCRSPRTPGPSATHAHDSSAYRGHA
jgi:hypothetical protein